MGFDNRYSGNFLFKFYAEKENHPESKTSRIRYRINKVLLKCITLFSGTTLISSAYFKYHSL